ncbi:hypothetical protein [Staphylococcus saprophyticus]|uniref:hypothetical protein n=1 Tax=Staphylococcus saprophyticus TaxID=29385 RepID=UPI000D1D9B9A|nr:hypothetical protein [Staphylococcus saprophyticus]MDW3898678.1 hypothetical protein [Staphylococcus saprophyticus]PTK12131.1 hypothetical protein BUZ75_07070 [Staphylococcus saprophyticus]WMM15307.1 hypothetical protein RCG45_11420 [Staphylococcus saprophyticus]
MSSDIILEGKHSQIIYSLNEKGLFNKKNGSAELFFFAVLKGMYLGEEGELDTGGNPINISRVYLDNSKRSNFKYLLNVFENLEKKFNGIDLTMNQIFLDSSGTYDSNKFQTIKNHGYAGLEKLHEEFLVENKINDSLDVIAVIEQDLLTANELEDIEIKQEPQEKNIEDLLESDIL